MQVAAHRGFIRKCLVHFATLAIIKSILEHCQPIVTCCKDFFHCNSSRKMSPIETFMKLSYQFWDIHFSYRTTKNTVSPTKIKQLTYQDIRSTFMCNSRPYLFGCTLWKIHTFEISDDIFVLLQFILNVY